MPICRAYCIWSTTTKFDTTMPSGSTKWSMPSMPIGLPVGSMPRSGPACVPVRCHCHCTKTPSGSAEGTPREGERLPDLRLRLLRSSASRSSNTSVAMNESGSERSRDVEADHAAQRSAGTDHLSPGGIDNFFA
jgi:hypothetical protein